MGEGEDRDRQMDDEYRDRRIGDLVAAAKCWAAALREWEATSRRLERPANLSEIKGRARRAERDLLEAIDALPP